MMSKRKPGWGTVLCVLLIVAIMLAPSPREWGAWGKWLSPRYDQIKPILEPVAHVVSMAVMAILIVRVQPHRPAWASMFSGLIISMVLAVVLELMQLVLPASFSRRFDLADMMFALMGALIGCLVGAKLNRQLHEHGT